MSNIAKAAFVKEVLQSTDWESDYSQRLHVVEHTVAKTKLNEWMSYKSACDIHSEGVLAAMVLQGTMHTQPHEKLDPNADSTLALRPEERLQYKEEKVQELETELEKNSVTRGSSDHAPSGDGADVTDDKTKMKEGLQLVKKTFNCWNTTAIDIKIKVFVVYFFDYFFSHYFT